MNWFDVDEDFKVTVLIGVVMLAILVFLGFFAEKSVGCRARAAQKYAEQHPDAKWVMSNDGGIVVPGCWDSYKDCMDAKALVGGGRKFCAPVQNEGICSHD